MEAVRNRRVDIRKKIDPDTIEEIENVIAVNAEAIERCREVVENLKGNQGWEALKRSYQERLETVEENLDGFDTLTDKGRDHLLSKRLDYKEFIVSVEYLEKRMERLHAENNEYKAALNEKKQRLRTVPL